MSTETISPYAVVAIGRPVRGEYTYLIPETLRGHLQPGQRVRVPFGRGVALGFYLAPAPEPPPEVRAKLKPITLALDGDAALTADVVELVRFAAHHYRYPLGEALRAALPPGLTRADEGKTAKGDVVLHARVLLADALHVLKRAPQQHAALSYLLAVGGRAPVEEVAHAIPGAREVLRRLAARGFVALEEQAVVKGVREGLQQGRPDALTDEQAAAVATLLPALEGRTFSPFLLHGVTGSGKTEVYLRVVERALELDRGALILSSDPQE